MEFKVFKNENNKILKEYWLTQSEWDALDKTTVQEGDIYHIVGTIDKGDLSADVNASLAKADSSLQKPTTTLAKESFVKVGIDGTQKFDEGSYVVAPSTDGTAGQVLKKTEAGTEWANESGGGKLYRHDVEISNIKENSNYIFQMSFLSRSVNQTTDITQIVTYEGFTQIVSLIGDIKINIIDTGSDSFPLTTAYGYFGGVIYNNGLASFYEIYYQELSVSNAGQETVPANITHVDTVTEL